MILLAVIFTLMPFIEGSGWPDPKCGRSLVRSRDRFIFDGRMAKDGEFPWMVLFYTVGADSQTYLCGASIIKRDAVLTAAHCVEEGFNINASRLFAGILDRTIRGRYTQERKIEQVIKHEDYRAGVTPDGSHDIALIKLTRPFDFAASEGRIGTVCLAVMPPQPGNVVTVAGWGYTSLHGNESDHLLVVTVPVLKDESCSNMYNLLFVAYHPEIMFCAGENRKQAAKGDSGGPAVVRRGRKSLQVGVTSFGPLWYPYHSVSFTKISSHIKWIFDALKKLE